MACGTSPPIPTNRGEAEKWYQPGAKLPAMPLPGYAPTANGKIRVPGIWDNQGYGTETDKVRHNFVGKGWYKRQVEIPHDWAGRRVFLAITGVSRYAKVWVNDHFLGEHIGYLSAAGIRRHQARRSRARPRRSPSRSIPSSGGRSTPCIGASSLADYMDVAWGGIWGHVSLEARSDAWLSDLFVQPDVPDSSCSASATLNGKADLADAAKLEVFDKSGQRVAEAAAKLDSKHRGGTVGKRQGRLPDAKLWTPDSPTLYTARLSLLKGGEVLDAVESRFGMRQFTIDGYRLLLNGKRLMLRGYGDDHIYPEQMAMPSDKELHLARLRIDQIVRLQPRPPPQHDHAAGVLRRLRRGGHDRHGRVSHLLQPVSCRERATPGKRVSRRARTRLPPSKPTSASGRPPSSDTGTILRSSVGSWATNFGMAFRCDTISNASPANSIPRGSSSIRDGVWGHRLCSQGRQHSGVREGPRHAGPLLPLRSMCSPIHSTIPPSTKRPGPSKPVISHEAGNYVTFSRPDLIDQFQHNIKPFWLTAGKAKLEKLGLLQEANHWAEKSERLYLLLHKYNLEALRKNPYLSGYHWWLFQDYWTTSNGIVDHYFRPKSIAKEEVLKFNNDVVLLQDGLERTYRGKGRLALKLLVSNFSPGPLQGELAWEVKAGDQSLAGQQTALEARCRRARWPRPPSIGLELPDVGAPTKLTITAELTAGGKTFTNDWSSWLYPAVIRPAASSVPVFADETQIKQCESWGVKPIPANGELSSHAVYVASWPCDPRVVDAMKRGASVVILDGAGQLMKAYGVTFRTSWWKAGDSPESNHTGTFVYDHPATRAMAPDGWCDDGWFHLIEDAQKCVFDEECGPPEIIVRALPSMVRVEDAALLFEVGVGKGSLIVSGLNHRRAAGRPENEWLVARLLDHAARISSATDGCPRKCRMLGD